MAFLKTSRYADLDTVQVQAAHGRTVSAVVLRVLPAVEGAPYVVQDDDRLDLIANHAYQDPALFWHIADANSELDARRLIQPGRQIGLPPTR